MKRLCSGQFPFVYIASNLSLLHFVFSDSQGALFVGVIGLSNVCVATSCASEVYVLPLDIEVLTGFPSFNFPKLLLQFKICKTIT